MTTSEKINAICAIITIVTLACGIYYVGSGHNLISEYQKEIQELIDKLIVCQGG